MAKKSKFPTKIIRIGIAIPVVVVVLVFGLGFGLAPTIEGCADIFCSTTPEEVTFQDILDESNALQGLTLPVCEVVSDCEDSFDLEIKTIVEYIIEQPKRGEQETDLDIVIIEGNETKIDKGIIIDPKPEPVETLTIDLISLVMKTDNTGKITESKTNFQLNPLLAFFVEDTSNIDFDEGFLEQTIILKTKADVEVDVIGKFDAFIGNTTILQNQVPISIKGITDQNGEIIINFNPSVGINSQTYLFQFNDNISKFIPEGITKVSFIVTELTVEAQSQKFGLTNATIFEMDIARDPTQLLIIKESGEITRAYPTDDPLTISATVGKYSWKVYQCLGFSRYLTCYGSYGYKTYSYATEAPAMGGGKVFNIKEDGTSQVVDAFASNPAGAGVVKLKIKLQRNEVYRIDFDSPKASITFKTPKDVVTSYLFYCTNQGNFPSLTIVCNYNDQKLKDSLAKTLE